MPEPIRWRDGNGGFWQPCREILIHEAPRSRFPRRREPARRKPGSRRSDGVSARHVTRRREVHHSTSAARRSASCAQSGRRSWTRSECCTVVHLRAALIWCAVGARRGARRQVPDGRRVAYRAAASELASTCEARQGYFWRSGSRPRNTSRAVASCAAKNLASSDAPSAFRSRTMRSSSARAAVSRRSVPTRAW